MTTWNMFDPAVSAMRTRLVNAWKTMGKYAGCPSRSTNYKQQALVELARRLEVESELARYKTLADAVDTLLDARDCPPEFDRAVDAVAKARVRCGEPKSAMAHESATLYFPDGMFDVHLVKLNLCQWCRDKDGLLFAIVYSHEQAVKQVEQHGFFMPYSPSYFTATPGTDALGYCQRPY